MSALYPLPTAVILQRILREFERDGSALGLPLRKQFDGAAQRGLDFSVALHGARAGTALGPAAGPHTQLAHNIVLAYLGGARIMELKTVQVHDRLELPRPCIDMATVGYNVEWSQELRVYDSTREYAKAALLIAILQHLGIPKGLAPHERPVIFDTSVGYDLAGIRTSKVTGFLRRMQDASAVIDTLRRELRQALPAPLRYLADVPVNRQLSNCCTLSTFHGCPPGEIEAIATYLLEELDFHVVVKMNPTLLGFEAVTTLLNDQLGYDDITVHQPAFAHDANFDQGLELIDRLREVGRRRDKSIGAKFTNTLVVENRRSFFPSSEKVMYLSGPPLYVIAMTLSAKFREAIGADLPISFSAGIDAKNYAEAVAAGLAPITTCTDLLKTGGYGRMRGYHDALAAAMQTLEVRDVKSFIVATDRQASGAQASGQEALHAAALRNHQRAAAGAAEDVRYHKLKNAKAPRKIGSHLLLFDCVNCDKCIPACPNDANFSYETPPRTVVYQNLLVVDGQLQAGEQQTLQLGGPKNATHQLANLSDLCNDCGNCDIFCPEDGGPYIEKPRIYRSRAGFDADDRPAFFIEQRGAQTIMHARRSGLRELTIDGDTALYYDGFAELVFYGNAAAPSDARLLNQAQEGHAVDVGIYHAMRALLDGLLDERASSYLAVSMEGEA